MSCRSCHTSGVFTPIACIGAPPALAMTGLWRLHRPHDLCILLLYAMVLCVRSLRNFNCRKGSYSLPRLRATNYASQSSNDIKKTANGNADGGAAVEVVLVNIDSKINHIMATAAINSNSDSASNSVQQLYHRSNKESRIHYFKESLIGSIITADESAKEAFRQTRHSLGSYFPPSQTVPETATTSSSSASNSSIGAKVDGLVSFVRRVKIDEKWTTISGVVGGNIEKWTRSIAGRKNEDDHINEILSAELAEEIERTAKSKRDRETADSETAKLKRASANKIVAFLADTWAPLAAKGSQLFPVTTKVLAKLRNVNENVQAIRDATEAYTPARRLRYLKSYLAGKVEPLADSLRYMALRAYLEATEYAPLLNYVRSAYRRRRRPGAARRNILASPDFAATAEETLLSSYSPPSPSNAALQKFPFPLITDGGSEAPRDEHSLMHERAGREKGNVHKDHMFALKQQYYEGMDAPASTGEPADGSRALPTIPMPVQISQFVQASIKSSKTAAPAPAPTGAKVVNSRSEAAGAATVHDEHSYVLSGSAPELTTWPAFADLPLLPQPSQIDILYLDQRMQLAAIEGAKEISSLDDAKIFIKNIGLKPLISGVLTAHCHTELQQAARVKAVKGLCTLVKYKKHLADNIALIPELVTVLIDMIEYPLHKWYSIKEVEALAQVEALNFMLRLVRSSDKAVKYLIDNSRLKKVLANIVTLNEESLESQMDSRTSSAPISAGDEGREGEGDGFIDSRGSRAKDKYSNTRVMDNHGLSLMQKARIAQWALGGVPWKPKQPGQKGLRILSFDGGGTRGVLSIALLQQLMDRLGTKYPHEVFDIICGTSTGGIIAFLLGGQLLNVDKTEKLYDDFVHKVFNSKSNLKLMTEQASYDEMELEKILHSFTGDDLFVDTNKNNCPRVFCVSTKVNNNPPQIQIFRNYNYPKGQTSRYGGSFQVNALTAVRATTAAPTFFTPVSWEGGLFCDGALVANNPTAVALQEAKALYPSVAIEYVVSIGTGIYNNHTGHDSMNWDLLVNQIIASSVDTEDVHTLLKDFLPEEKYLRINPVLADNLPIDTTDPAKLATLKRLARHLFARVDEVAAAHGEQQQEEHKHLLNFIGKVRRNNRV